MWNALNKIFSMALLLCCMASCSDGGQGAARELLAQADSALAAQNYHQALEVLDTLNSRHRDQTAVRREGLLLRARAFEGIARDSISIASDELVAASAVLDSLRPMFTHVPGPEGVTGFFLPNGTESRIMGATALQARVDEDGLFYVVVNVSGRRPGIQCITMTDGADSYTSSAVTDARIVDVAGSQSASFSPEDVEGMGQWLEAHPGASRASVTVRHGADVVINLTPALKKEIVRCYRFSQALQAQRRASIHREKYERMLATARDQIANLTPVAQ